MHNQVTLNKFLQHINIKVNCQDKLENCLVERLIGKNDQVLRLVLVLPVEAVEVKFWQELGAELWSSLETQITDKLKLKSCSIEFIWREKPNSIQIEAAFPIWQTWCTNEITKVDNKLATAFLKSPIRFIDGEIYFTLLPIYKEFFHKYNLATIALLFSAKVGLPFNFQLQELDLSSVDQQMQEDYQKEMCHIEDEPQEISKPSRPKNNDFQPSFRRVDGQIFGKWNVKCPELSLGDITPESGLITVTGYVKNFSLRMVSNNQRAVVKFDLQDKTGAISCVCFLASKNTEHMESFAKLEKDSYISCQIEVGFDARFTGDIQGIVKAVRVVDKPASRVDSAINKRVELHCHTKMSAKDAISDPEAVVKLAANFGHEAVAITDHGVVQGFPAAFEAAKSMAKAGKPIKLIYGMEGYIVPDGEAVVYGLYLPRGEAAEVDTDEGTKRPTSFVAIDTETTGLDSTVDRLIEIGAARFTLQDDGAYKVVDSFSTLVNPGIKLPANIIELTGISQNDVEQGVDHLTAVQKLLEFVGDDPICAHNAIFDLGFIRKEGFRTVDINDPKLKFNPITVDTVALARVIWPGLKNYKLDTVCNFLQISLENHHRAADDAIACGEILARALQREPDLTFDELNRRSGLLNRHEITNKANKTNHIILLVRDLLGLYNLYRLVSISHTQYFHNRPRIPKHLLTYFRHGIVIGAACEAGEVFRYIRAKYEANNCNMEQTKLDLNNFVAKKLARYYDYLEIQPLVNNYFLTKRNENPLTQQDLINLNLLVIHLAKLCKKMVVATCDSHFLNREDAEFRHILMTNIGYSVNERQPELFFRNTEEMLAEFTYLSPEEAMEYCVLNTQKVATMIEADIRPFPDGTFPPLIASADKDVEDLTWTSAKKLYEYNGELPEIVSKRIVKELDSIIKNGFAIMYYIAHKLVKKSNDDGYIVGSRGSVGSSFVATLCGITEVNPLCPHYRCPNCNYSIFDETGNYGSGFDLPQAECPKCGTTMLRDGQDIPFETFLGFNGDKQPDIDLNFSGVYQPRAHKYIQDMFGTAHTFRAGTIGCFAEKNALGMVKKYMELKGITLAKADQLRLASGMDGVKRTTGQHPGGIVVIPKEREVFDFTPIQYPADKQDSVMTTTHFDFNSLHDTILKLDILGHDDPTMLKVLSDMTGIDVINIPIPDEKVMQMFVSTEPINIADGTSPAGSATLGLPEMGTFMARDMIKETKPTKFYDLVQLMGLSHGTDVWKGNAQNLISEGICTINEVIGCRDGIMTSLIYYGLPSKVAFDIMEKVRKGKGLTPDQENLMRENKVPDWYIDSCKKIKYMFPKAHAAAYVISALRIAWFKVYHPEAYYSAYFTVRADEFDSSVLCQGQEHLQNEKKRLRLAFSDPNGKEKDKNLFYIAEIVEEMNLRGIKFLPIDIYASEPENFKPEGKGFIRPPLNAVPSVSTAVANAIATERCNGKFKTQSELLQRTKIGAASLQALVDNNCLGDMPESNQLDIFSMM